MHSLHAEVQTDAFAELFVFRIRTRLPCFKACSRTGKDWSVYLTLSSAPSPPRENPPTSMQTEHRHHKNNSSRQILTNIGALIIRIGFWDPVYYNYDKEPRQ